jgi:GDP/UDP-N,N'-diacetylbacillosamine 2-epimerase (hydrolysing)
MLIVLGDRFEIFACCSAAAMTQIPIVHLYGGDTTECLIDEFIRHSITKMSYLHFVSNELSRRRVIQMGEEPSRVYNVGALGIENILNLHYMDKTSIYDDLRLNPTLPYSLVTFHPTTLERGTAKTQTIELLNALLRFDDMQYVITRANADDSGRTINAIFEKYAKEHDRLFLFDSLGMVRYLSAMKYAEMVIGNSSSGLYETPSFHIPTINIGDRQKGRLQAKSILDAKPVASDIVDKISYAMTTGFRQIALKAINPYGDGHTSEKIMSVIKKYLADDAIDIRKTFYTIPFEDENI